MDPNRRVELLQQMLKENPSDPFLNYAQALEQIKEGKADEAEKVLKKILTADESYLAAYYQLGKLYEQKQNMEDAISVYKKGIEKAMEKKDMRTLGELEEALMIIDEEAGGG
jgi:tetratricopeptide (TPR) repeat protein